MPKHFKATHKESGDVVYFDLGDIMEVAGQGIHIWDSERMCPRKVCKLFSDVEMITDWLKDYDLQYLHNGEYHDYEEGRE
jgi:hypothetical protein